MLQRQILTKLKNKIWESSQNSRLNHPYKKIIISKIQVQQPYIKYLNKIEYFKFNKFVFYLRITVNSLTPRIL